MRMELSGGKRNGLQCPRQLLHCWKWFIARGGEGRKHHPSGMLTGKAVPRSGLTPGCYSSTILSYRPWHPASPTQEWETTPETIQLQGDCILPATTQKASEEERRWEKVRHKSTAYASCRREKPLLRWGSEERDLLETTQ